MSHSQRITISVPEELAEDLKNLSGALGVSQSAFVTSLLSDSVGQFKPSRIKQRSGSTSSEVSKRYRGSSINLVARRVEKARKK